MFENKCLNNVWTMSEQCLNNVWTIFEQCLKKCLNKCLKTNKQIFDWLGTNIERTNVGFSKCLIDWEQTNKCLRANTCLNNAWTVFERCLKNVWTNVWKTNKCLRTNIEKTNVGFRFLSADWPSNRSAWQRQNWPARRLLTIRPGGVWSLTRVAFYNFEGWGAQREGVVAWVCSKFLQNCKHSF